MIFHSPNMAMLLASAVSVLTFLWAAWFSIQVVWKWDIKSAHASQLALEQRTYLVSTALVFVMVIELSSLILFVFNADDMAGMFVGAMCALGTLNVNDYGMPALMLKVAVFFGSAIWLIINHADGKGRDYPMTRFKYAWLLLLTPLAITSAGYQLTYFLELDPNVITSCCSLLFTPDRPGVEAQLASFDPQLSLYALFVALAVMVIFGMVLRWKEKGYVVYSLASIGFFIIAIIAIIAVVSSYVYEQPHHHCPFCILKPEYNYIGYFLYLPLFVATAFAVSNGLLSLQGGADSLKTELPLILKRNTTISTVLFAVFGIITIYIILSSNLIL